MAATPRTEALDLAQSQRVTDIVMANLNTVKSDLEEKLARLSEMMETASKNYDDMNAKLEGAQKKITDIEQSSATTQRTSQGLLDTVRTQEAELVTKLQQTRVEIGNEFNTQREQVN